MSSIGEVNVSFYHPTVFSDGCKWANIGHPVSLIKANSFLTITWRHIWPLIVVCTTPSTSDWVGQTMSGMKIGLKIYSIGD